MSTKALSFDLKKLKLPDWLHFGAPAMSAGSGLTVKYPRVALDMGVHAFSLARLTTDRITKKLTLTSYDMVELPPDLVESDVFSMNIKAPERMRALMAGALSKEGVKTTAVSLLLPDHLARVALIPFEELPRTRREVIELVRWRMKKAVPFKVEEAAVDYQVLPAASGAAGYTLLVVLLPRGIVEQHESILRQLGIHPGLVDISSFSLVHLYRPVIEKEVPPEGDFLMVNLTASFFTLMIFRAGSIIFYRCKNFAFGGESVGDESTSQSALRLIRRELSGSLNYYQERLEGKGLSRFYLRIAGHDPASVMAIFNEASPGVRPEPIDVSRVVAVSGRLAAAGPDHAREVLQRVAPAVGAALGRDGSAVA